VHYIPLYHHPLFHRNVPWEKLKYPNMELYYQQALSLPLYADLTEADIERVCKELLAIILQ
jgi:dTDP-4-amino-4,6-dideoxygalactose transaminase